MRLAQHIQQYHSADEKLQQSKLTHRCTAKVDHYHIYTSLTLFPLDMQSELWESHSSSATQFPSILPL